MGKKGRRKGKNLAKMSEEQKARYLQQRADAEEEARQRKMQLIALFMKNKLKREDAFCRLNMAKINQNWRSILRQLKCEEQRKEMIELQATFQEAIERKDRTISRLLNDLEAAEDSYARMQNAHMEIINKLLEIYQQRAEFFRNFNKQQEDIVLQENEEDHKDFKMLSDQAQEQLECVAYQLEDRREKQLKENYEHHLEKVDDLKATMQLRLEKIIESREARLESLWHEYQDVLNGYIQRTETFYADYIELKERDEESTKMSLANCSEIERLSEQLESLKLKYGDAKESTDFKVKQMTEKRNELAEQFAKRKLEVDQEMRQGEEILKIMCVKSYKILKTLKEMQAKGESMLTMAAICRKYETQRELIAPVCEAPPPPPPSSSSSSSGSRSRDSFAPSVEQMKKPPAELKEDVPLEIWRKMENFWWRVNNVQVDVLYLEQEKLLLKQENERLKRLLRERLADLNIAHGSNAHVNDYLTRRPLSMRLERVRSIELEKAKPKCRSASVGGVGSRPIIEANFTNAVVGRSSASCLPKIHTTANGWMSMA